MTSHAPMLDFAGSILYLAALLGDRPRAIDHYIDSAYRVDSERYSMS